MEKRYTNVHMSIYIHIYIDIENVGSPQIDSPLFPSPPPEFSSLYRCPNVSIPSRSRRNASNTSILAVCFCLTFFPSLLSPRPFYPQSIRKRPPFGIDLSLLTSFIHTRLSTSRCDSLSFLARRYRSLTSQRRSVALAGFKPSKQCGP